jgi:hypothetical protein
MPSCRHAARSCVAFSAKVSPGHWLTSQFMPSPLWAEANPPTVRPELSCTWTRLPTNLSLSAGSGTWRTCADLPRSACLAWTSSANGASPRPVEACPRLRWAEGGSGRIVAVTAYVPVYDRLWR